MLRKILLYVLTMVVLAIPLLYAGIVNNVIGIDFPQLSGSYPVGRASYDLVDPSRKEIFDSDPNADREIVVKVYYPAVPPAGAQPAPYASGRMADLLAGKVHL